MTSDTGTFDWETSGLQESEFSALATLLSFRGGGQIEAPWNEDITEVSERFLDCFAELLTTRLKPRYIACTAFCRTADGEITVFAARNNGFDDAADQKFLEVVGKWMRNAESTKEDEHFWHEMLSYCRYRFEDIAKFAKQVGKRVDTVESNKDIDTLTTLSDLCARSIAVITESEALLDLALEIQKSNLVKHLLSYRLGLNGRKLGLMIRSLARMRDTFQIFRSFRSSIWGSSGFSVNPIRSPQKGRCSSEVNLDEMLKGLLGMSIDDTAVRKYISKRRSMDCLRRDFEHTRTLSLCVHAEVQIVLQALKAGINEFVKYIGCSMRSCFLCWSFLRHLPWKFRTRGSHGILYCRWTVSRTEGIPLEAVAGIKHSLSAVRDEVEMCLKEPRMGIQLRCAGCPRRVFIDARAISQHCSATGHCPAESTRSTTTTLQVSRSEDPIHQFFGRYPTFDYHARGAYRNQFRRLRRHKDWHNENKELIEAEKEFRLAVVRAFGIDFGVGKDDTEAWGRLCTAAGISVPGDLESRKQAFLTKHVSLVNLHESWRKQLPARVFTTANELRRYMKKRGKYFAKDEAKAGELLLFLLRAS